MEMFSKLVTCVEEVGALSGYWIGDEGLSVVLLQFAANSLIFLPNCKEEVGNLRAILLIMFEAVIGLKVNLPKSTMMVVGDVSNLRQLVALLGCAMIDLPGV